MTQALDDPVTTGPPWRAAVALVLTATGIVLLVAGVKAVVEDEHPGVAVVAPEPDLPVAREPAPPPAASGAAPVTIRIPRIDVDASVIDLGLNPEGTLEVPQNFDQTGWYTGRSVPGDVGTSVVVGHVDSYEGPAVFFRLRELEEGDLVEVERTDGTVAEFRVTRRLDIDKDEFPTRAVYGQTEHPTLRLVTCGGDFDHDEGSYTGNLIVFAEHLGNRPSVNAT